MLTPEKMSTPERTPGEFYFRQITWEGLLGKREARNLPPIRDLATTGVTLIGAYDPEKQVHEYAIIPQATIYGHGLVDLLAHAAPYPNFGRSERPILDDWALPDQSGEDNELLLRRHQRLGSAWNEFMRHREPFIQAMRARLDVLDLVWKLTYIADPTTLGTTSNERTETTVYLLKLFQEPAVVESRWCTDSSLLAECNRIIHDEQIRQQYANLVSSITRPDFSNQEYMDYIRRKIAGENAFLAWLDPKYLRALYAGRAAQMNSVALFGDDTKSLRLIDNTLITPLGKARFQALIRGNPAFPVVVYGPMRANHSPLSISDETDYRGVGIRPVLRWRTDASGEREWNFAFLNQGVFAPIASQLIQGDLPPKMTVDPRHASPLAGLLLSANPRIISQKKWPETVRLDSDGDPQYMGPAQVPVLALMRQRDLLASPILEKAETQLLTRGKPGQAPILPLVALS